MRTVLDIKSSNVVRSQAFSPGNGSLANRQKLKSNNAPNQPVCADTFDSSKTEPGDRVSGVITAGLLGAAAGFCGIGLGVATSIAAPHLAPAIPGNALLEGTWSVGAGLALTAVTTALMGLTAHATPEYYDSRVPGSFQKMKTRERENLVQGLELGATIGVSLSAGAVFGLKGVAGLAAATAATAALNGYVPTLEDSFF